MAQIRWTFQAAAGLETITKFIAVDSSQYAQLFALDVIKTVDHLSTFPRSGRVVPELGNTAIREKILGNYRIVYRFRKNMVEILTIYHGARLLDPSDLE